MLVGCVVDAFSLLVAVDGAIKPLIMIKPITSEYLSRFQHQLGQK